MTLQTAPSTSQQVQTEHHMLLNGPAGTPPAGIIPNFDDPPNLDVYIYLTLSLCSILATLAFFIRMYTKVVLLRAVGYEDYFSVISWIGFIGMLVPTIMAQRSGLGTHMWDIRLKTFFRLLYLENISSILYGITVCLIKISILLQYHRLFVVQKSWRSPMFVTVQFCVWAIFLFYLIETFLEIFQCSPREKIWNKLLTGGHCLNSSAGFKVTGVFNSISDFALLSIPMSALWKLQMPLKRKLLTMGIFAVGVLACVASIIRAYYTWVVARAVDESYSLVFLSFCAAAELAIGIIVGSFPVMPKFFQHASVKVSRVLSFASKSAIKSDQESERISDASKVNALDRLKRSFATHKATSDLTEAWRDSCYLRAERHGEYLTLGEVSSLQATDSVQPQSLGIGTATRREDLEYGPHTN